MDSADIAASSPDLLLDVHFLASRAGALGGIEANRALAAFGLRVRSFCVLSIACTASPQSQKEIAETLLLDPSQVVMLVDGLESRGLVQRIPDPGDRRARLVTAIPPGRALYAEAKESVAAVNRELLHAFDEEEIATLLTLLRRFVPTRRPARRG